MTTANVTSVESLRSLKAALVKFCADVEAALVALELEARRPVEWVEGDRARYWPQQARRASDAVNEARQALARCEQKVSQEDVRSCYDERKALEKARRRLELAEDRTRSVRRWSVEIQKAAEEFTMQAARLRNYLETDLAKGIASVERMSAALDRYVEQKSTQSG